MQLLIVTFNLKDLSDEDYRQACVDEAPSFAALPGLVSKTWLADEATNTYGGVYAFEDGNRLDAYLGSDLFKGFATDPTLPNLSVRAFEILDAPGAITRGLAAMNPVAL
jgi:hypothetical protein